MKNIKLSKLIHVASVIVGLVGAIIFTTTIFGGANNLVFGITKVDTLLCTGILFLIAIWLQIASIHHMMLEKKGEII